MKFDISRDFLDGIMLQHPAHADREKDIKANGGVHFLPSSPDGTMHTGVVSFALVSDGNEAPFAKAGWRFLFTTDEAWDPKNDQQHPFHGQLLVHGASKIIAVMNGLCLNANMPLVPISAESLVGQLRRRSGGQDEDGATPGGT